MTWRIEAPRLIGPYVVAALVESTVMARPSPQGVTGSGQKKPLMVVLVRGGDVTGYTLDGRTHTSDEIEARFPTAAAQITALIRDPV